MSYYSIYGKKGESEIKNLFHAIPETRVVYGIYTANKNGYEITTIIKLGGTENFFMDTDVTNEFLMVTSNESKFGN